MTEARITRTYGDGGRLTTTHDVRPRVIEDSALDKMRTGWTEADRRFERKLKKRYGWR